MGVEMGEVIKIIVIVVLIIVAIGLVVTNIRISAAGKSLRH